MKKYLSILFTIVFFVGFTTELIANDRSIVKIGSEIRVERDERVDDAVAIGRDVYIDGIVDGDAVSIGGTIHLGEEAIVHGDVVTVGGSLERAEGAKVFGSTVDVGSFDISSVIDGSNFFHGYHGIPRVFKIIPFLGLIALVLLFAVLIPNELKSIANYISDEPLKIFLYGLLGAILIVPLIILLAISIIGIVLIPFVVIAIILALIIGYIAVAIIIGKKILQALNKESPALMLSALLGILVLWLIGFIPFFGSLVKCIATIFGFGAVIMAVAMHRKRKKEVVVVSEPKETVVEQEV